MNHTALYFVFWGVCCLFCFAVLGGFFIWFENYKINKWSKMIDSKIEKYFTERDKK